MIEVSKKTYYIKDIELAVLLAAKGIRNYYGFKINGLDEIDEGLLHQMLFELARKNIISVVDDKFEVIPAFESILLNIKNANKVLFTSYSEAEKPQQSVYIGEKAVIIQACGSMGEMYRITETNISEYPYVLMEQGIKMESFIEEDADKGVVKAELTEELFGILRNGYSDKEQVHEKMHSSIAIEIVNAVSMKREKVLFLLTHKAMDYICECDEQDITAYEYNENALVQILLEL